MHMITDTIKNSALFNQSIRRVALNYFPAKLLIECALWRKCSSDKHIVNLIKSHCDPQKISIDVGAHYGAFTYLMAKRSRKVHAFEPNLNAYKFLKRLRLSNVVVHNEAVSDADGTNTLFVPTGDNRDWSAVGSLDEDFAGRYGIDLQPQVVSVVALDGQDLANVGFIKIDVEGYEWNVIRGATELIKRDKPKIIVETANRNCGMIDDLLTMGYRAYRITDQGLTPVQRGENKGGDIFFSA